VRIIKKIRAEKGVWKFISLDKVDGRYIWDNREGYYFIEWWEGKKRLRELAGQSPSEALESQRRKRNEIIGELIAGGQEIKLVEENSKALRIETAIELYAAHIKTHSPGKPRTLERYSEVLRHFDRLLGKKKYVEAITRSDIDAYKNARSQETVKESERKISPATINFEVNTLRSFFYYLIRERGVQMENPCARFKILRSTKEKLNRRPPTYDQDELDLLFAACDQTNRVIYTTLLLTGLRKDELNHLAWSDIDFEKREVRVKAKDDFMRWSRFDGHEILLAKSSTVMKKSAQNKTIKTRRKYDISHRIASEDHCCR
jgi:site-specific recombinase XerC